MNDTSSSGCNETKGMDVRHDILVEPTLAKFHESYRHVPAHMASDLLLNASRLKIGIGDGNMGPHLLQSLGGNNIDT